MALYKFRIIIITIIIIIIIMITLHLWPSIITVNVKIVDKFNSVIR